MYIGGNCSYFGTSYDGFGFTGAWFHNILYLWIGKSIGWIIINQTFVIRFLVPGLARVSGSGMSGMVAFQERVTQFG